MSAIDANAPGPAHLSRLRKQIIEERIDCIFIEPQLNQKIVNTIAEGTGARVGVLDPLGAVIEMGNCMYGTL